MSPLTLTRSPSWASCGVHYSQGGERLPACRRAHPVTLSLTSLVNGRFCERVLRQAVTMDVPYDLLPPCPIRESALPHEPLCATRFQRCPARLMLLRAALGDFAEGVVHAMSCALDAAALVR